MVGAGVLYGGSMCMLGKLFKKKSKEKTQKKQEDTPSKKQTKQEVRKNNRDINHLSESGLNLIKRFEGLRLQSYQDIAGVWTVGYGHTGNDVKPDQTITESRATELLRHDVAKFEKGVKSATKTSISQKQFDALVSLSYNIGLSAFKRSTVLKRLNDGDHEGAANAILMWNKATIDGELKEVKGLTRRRKAERRLFLEGTNEKGA